MTWIIILDRKLIESSNDKMISHGATRRKKLIRDNREAIEDGGRRMFRSSTGGWDGGKH